MHENLPAACRACLALAGLVLPACESLGPGAELNEPWLGRWGRLIRAGHRLSPSAAVCTYGTPGLSAAGTAH